MDYWKWMKNNLMKHIQFIALSFFLLAAFPLTAQNDLPVDEVEVIKKFDARLGQFSIVPNSPVLPKADTISRKKYGYTVSQSPLSVNYVPEALRPLAMPRSKETAAYRGYAKAAYGLPNSILGQVNYAFAGNNGFELGVHALHNSVNNNKKLENQRYMYNNGGVSVAQEFKGGLRLHANMDYSMNDNNIYGYDHEQYSYTKNETLRRYHWFRTEAGISNSALNKSSINYDARFQYQRFANNVATRQNDYNLYLSGTKWFDNAHPLTIVLGTEFTDLRDTTKHNLNNFFLKPSYTYHASTYKVKAGMSVYSNSDEFYFYPDAEFEIYIPDNRFIGFVGADGGLTKNTYSSLARYNPFVEARLDTIGNTNDRRYYAGLKGQFGNFSYRGTVAYQTFNFMAAYKPYTPGPLNYGFYDVDFLDGSRINLQLSAGYRIMENMNLMLTTSKYIYMNGLHPGGLPTFELNAQLEYFLLQDQLRLWTELYLMDKILFDIDTELAGSEPNFGYDFNLGGEYFFSKYFGVSVQLHNIFDNKFMRWYNAPTIGFQGLIGLTARF